MEITPELISRYHKGLCSADEQKAVKEWMDNTHFDFSAVEEISFQNKQEIKQRIWERIDLGRQTVPLWKRYGAVFSGVAAVFLLVSGLWLYIGSSQSEKAFTEASLSQVIKTKKGQRASLALPDGTHVVLNGESEIRFPSSFTDSVRMVSLSGEAYFKVTKNPAQPFVVETGATRTRVLGTSFGLKAYPGEQMNTLVVSEGRVRFSDRHDLKSEILVAGQQAVFHDGQLDVRSKINSNEALAWTKNILLLNDMTLEQIAVVLERWYDVKITIKTEALKTERYTGQFSNSPLDAVVKSMSYAIRFRYKTEEKSIIIY